MRFLIITSLFIANNIFSMEFSVIGIRSGHIEQDLGQSQKEIKFLDKSLENLNTNDVPEADFYLVMLDGRHLLEEYNSFFTVDAAQKFSKKDRDIKYLIYNAPEIDVI